MAQQVVHLEITGSDPDTLHRYYRELFGWEYESDEAATATVSEPGHHWFVDASVAGVNSGVGGGAGHRPRVVFYVGVPDVEAALQEAERLGGTRVMGPEGTPGRIVVGHFSDPEGNEIGVAGPQ